MKTLARDELKKMNETDHEDFVLINVLSRDDFNKKHIRTSINIPHGEPGFEQKVDDIAGGLDRKIVLYCASFDCPASTEACEKLEEYGFSQVYDYEGGTKDWFEKKQARAA